MAPIAASMARVHLILTPCSWALSEFSEIKTVHSLTPACSTFIRAIAAPERQVVEIPSVKPSAKQNNRVPGRLMRIRTLTSENPAEAPATSRERRELPVGSWEEGLTADTWQRHLLYPLSFYEQFIAHITRSSYAIYGQGMGPFFLELKNDPSHLGPDLGPVGQAILEAEGGKTGLLALLTSFPTSKDSCKKIGNLYLPFFTVDDCIEQRSILREAEETARWCKALWHMSESGDYSQAVAAVPACFATDPKLCEAAALYCSAVEAYHSRAIKVDSIWPRWFSYAMYLYALATIEETKRSTAFRDKGKVPTLTEYLRYRCCSIGHMPVLTLVAVESSICLSGERFARAVPLFVYAALLASLMNDIMAAAKDAAEGTPNVVTIVEQKRAAHVHNVLMDCLCEEIERFMAGAEPGDCSQEFDDAIRASVFGGFMWMNTCSRYRPFVERTRQPVAIADCPEGRLTDTRSPLYREMRELVASLSCRVAEGFL